MQSICGKMEAMNTELHYSRAPLTEAIIDLRVQLPEWADLETLARIQSGQEANYPTRRDRGIITGQFSSDPATPPTTGDRVQTGYEFVSKDEHHVVQVHLDRFTFSRLAPYETWASFRDEARRWWDIYRTTVQPTSITRIAVRYINRIDLHLPVNELKDYLRTVPEISPDLPQSISGYFMQLQIPQTDIESMLILNEALLPAPKEIENAVSVLLDIDLFRDTDIPQDEESLWRFFEQLRNRKNEVFEGCITDNTRRLIT